MPDVGELQRQVHLMLAHTLTSEQYQELIKTLTLNLKEIVDEAKKEFLTILLLPTNTGISPAFLFTEYNHWFVKWFGE